MADEKFKMFTIDTFSDIRTGFLNVDSYLNIFLELSPYTFAYYDNNTYVFNEKAEQYEKIDVFDLVECVKNIIILNKYELSKLEKGKKIINYLLSISSKSPLIESLKTYIKNNFKVNIENYKNKIFFKNGILNLESMEFNKITKNDFITDIVKLNYDYNPNNTEKETAELKAQLMRTANDDTETYDYIINMLAAALTRQKYEALFFNFTGVGGNGKTFIMELAELVFESKYIKKLDNNAIYEKGNNKHKALNKIQTLPVLSLGYFDEVKDKLLDMNRIKDLSGGKTIESEQLYANESKLININSYFCLVSNNTLRFVSEGESLIRRGRTIEFKNIFHENYEDFKKFEQIPGHYKADKDLMNKMNSEKYKNAFINLLIPGFRNYYQYKSIIGGMKFKEAFAEVNKANDFFNEFIDKKYIKCSCINCNIHKIAFNDIINKYNLEYSKKNMYKRSDLINDLKRNNLKYRNDTNLKNQRGTVYGLIEKADYDTLDNDDYEEVKTVSILMENDKPETVAKLMENEQIKIIEKDEEFKENRELKEELRLLNEIITKIEKENNEYSEVNTNLLNENLGYVEVIEDNKEEIQKLKNEIEKQNKIINNFNEKVKQLNEQIQELIKNQKKPRNTRTINKYNINNK